MCSSDLQALGNHERALVILRHLISEFPAAAENHEVRKLVATSERALGRTTSLLPKRTFSLREVFDSRSGKYPAWMRWTALLSLATLLLVVGMAGLNEYYRRNRTLHVVNAFGQPLQVTIDAGPAIEVVNQGKVNLPEGRHRVEVTGPFAEATQITLETPYFSRWTNDPIWIFNPGNAGLVVRHDLEYAAAPRPTQSIRLDDEFQYVPHVDYAFTTPPRSLRIDNRSSIVKKVAVEVNSVDPAAYFQIGRAHV